jgi:Hydantoinase B/oxoprolinase
MQHQVRSSDDDATRRVDPFLMSVLKSRFEAIVREMTLVVMKASRSAVIKNAKDLSCAILTYDHRLVSTEEALPIHVMSMDKATRPITELFDDIKQGDIFLNNCPYTGGTHHADMILSMPVFFRGAPLFWVVALSHHADTGAPVPSTYLPYARTIYEEGLHFPCVRIAENYQEKADILRIGLKRAFPRFGSAICARRSAPARPARDESSNYWTAMGPKRSWTLSRIGSITAGVAPSPRSKSCRRAFSNMKSITTLCPVWPTKAFRSV